MLTLSCLMIVMLASAGFAATVIKIAHPNVPSHPEGQAFVQVQS
ncbi:MAG: hypothetical protein V8Q84_07025 [Bilophila sp.]